ncbi:hypothetical protein PAXRUDRAFT_830771 [Paxillus rubicundulus Ve08.2h10]|uniref:C2H2-type domain-containing protein n=1 Tax=Paxillus rubicundulus Ve08.2h10 TaxID=930991 RepID=A0A0D0D4N3_9AGAM|nr:hypothetical protein PAXRUDRAFT_830771 [Paxillus rubicundulus Ve08.2h10]
MGTTRDACCTPISFHLRKLLTPYSSSTSTSSWQLSPTISGDYYHSLSDLRTSQSTVNQMDTGRFCISNHVDQPETHVQNNESSFPSPYPQPECNQCPQEAAPCGETACLIPEITSECTNECLVVACDDPSHVGSSCHVTDGSAMCDDGCIPAMNCADCPGLEEILQCCTDYHPYVTEPKSHDALGAMGWEPSLSDIMFCRCGENTQDVSITNQLPPMEPLYPANLFPQSISALASDSPPSSSIHTTPSPSLSAAVPQSYTESPVISQQAPVPPFACMWGNCGSMFSTLSELVGHVNLEHLRAAGAQPEVTVQSRDNAHPSIQDTLSCHWGNCAMYPTPSSIPSGSSASPDNGMLNVLTTHFMQDHLGLNYSFPTSTTPKPGLSVLQNTGSTGSVPQPSTPPVHEYSENHVCKWLSCTQTFTSCDDLTTHIASVHVGSGKAHYECFWEGCARHGENGFPSKQKISRHLQSHTGHRPFQCRQCHQNFSEAATLQQHMRRHTQEKPYVCDYPGCGKAFAITGALTIHKRTHNGLRPFKCTYCDKTFSESSNLSKHLRTHTGARPYLCAEDGCGKSFARPDQLARHMSIHRKKTT